MINSNLKDVCFNAHKVLPLVYDESLSYYELLCKVVRYINDIIADEKIISNDVSELRKELESAISVLSNFINISTLTDESDVTEIIRTFDNKYPNKILVIDKNCYITGESGSIEMITNSGKHKLKVRNNSKLIVNNILSLDKSAIFDVEELDYSNYTNDYELDVRCPVYPEYFGGAVYNAPIHSADEIYELASYEDMGQYIMHAFRAVNGRYISPISDGVTKNFASNTSSVIKLSSGYYNIKRPIILGTTYNNTIYGFSGLDFGGEGIGASYLFATYNFNEPILSINFGNGEQKHFHDFKIAATFVDSERQLTYDGKFRSCINCNSNDSIILSNIWVSGAQYNHDDERYGSGFYFNSCIDCMCINLQVEHCNHAISCYSGTIDISNIDTYSIHKDVIIYDNCEIWSSSPNVSGSLLITNMSMLKSKSLCKFNTNGKLQLTNYNNTITNGGDYLVYVNDGITANININNAVTETAPPRLLYSKPNSRTIFTFDNFFYYSGDVVSYPCITADGVVDVILTNGKFTSTPITPILNTEGCNVIIKNIVYEQCGTHGGSSMFTFLSDKCNVIMEDITFRDNILVVGSPSDCYLAYSPVLTNNVRVNNIMNTTPQTINLITATSPKIYQCEYTALN